MDATDTCGNPSISKTLTFNHHHQTLLWRPGTKPKQWWRRWSGYGGRFEAHPKLGFRPFVGKFRRFLPELDFSSGMKVVPLGLFYISVKFENFWN
ncbi:hypothetical protein ACFX1W_038196 [Malus domestica]